MELTRSDSKSDTKRPHKKVFEQFIKYGQSLTSVLNDPRVLLNLIQTKRKQVSTPKDWYSPDMVVNPPPEFPAVQVGDFGRYVDSINEVS